MGVTISFQTRFDRALSNIARDAVLMCSNTQTTEIVDLDNRPRVT
jgi:hypothetical protein